MQQVAVMNASSSRDALVTGSSAGRFSTEVTGSAVAVGKRPPLLLSRRVPGKCSVSLRSRARSQTAPKEIGQGMVQGEQARRSVSNSRSQSVSTETESVTLHPGLFS